MRRQPRQAAVCTVGLISVSLVILQLLTASQPCFPSTEQQPIDIRPSNTKSSIYDRIPLLDLVNTHPEHFCPQGLELVQDSIHDTFFLDKDDTTTRLIPRLVHITATSRCLHPSFVAIINQWKNLTNHTLVFHNEAAVDRLLSHPSRVFPQLQHAIPCTLSGAGKIDLWRALVLYDYGGLYTDMDNAPNAFHATTIAPTDQAFFVVEEGGYLSQYFMASAPRHALFYMLLMVTMHRLMDLYDIHNQYVPFVTGPGALKQAFVMFMRDQGQNVPKSKLPLGAATSRYAHKVPAGVYQGLDQGTVRVMGTSNHPNAIVARNVIYKKKNLYGVQNMTHFSKIPRRVSNISCLEQVYYTRIKKEF